MKISIITVAYNAARTIGAALKSVADQRHPDIEHIVIEGASKDATLDVIRQNADRVTTIVSEPDKGIYDAMNKGLARASGDVIAFLNADDRYASVDAISSVVEIFEHHHVDAVLGDVAFFDLKSPERLIRRYRSDRFTPARLAYGWMPAHPGLFVRRAEYVRAGRFATSYRIAGDYEMIIRLFSRPELRYRHLPEILVHMQTGGASTAGIKAKLQLNREVLRACRENGIDTNMVKILSKYPAKLLEYLSR